MKWCEVCGNEATYHVTEIRKGVSVNRHLCEEHGRKHLALAGFEVSPPQLCVAWDPELIDPETYTELVSALGDLVRAQKGLGLELIESQTIEVHANNEVLV